MLETLTKSGAVIHTDSNNADQNMMLKVAIAAFGGIASQMELTEEVAQ